jgi:hypothetical protein
MVVSYQEQMAAPPVGQGWEQATTAATAGTAATAVRREQAGHCRPGLSTNNDADGGPSPSPSLPPYTMVPSAPLPFYKKRKTVIGYYALWQ